MKLNKVYPLIFLYEREKEEHQTSSREFCFDTGESIQVVATITTDLRADGGAYPEKSPETPG
jgi:hypothetical protein